MGQVGHNNVDNSIKEELRIGVYVFFKMSDMVLVIGKYRLALFVFCYCCSLAIVML